MTQVDSFDSPRVLTFSSFYLFYNRKKQQTSLKAGTRLVFSLSTRISSKHECLQYVWPSIEPLQIRRRNPSQQPQQNHRHVEQIRTTSCLSRCLPMSPTPSRNRQNVGKQVVRLLGLSKLPVTLKKKFWLPHELRNVLVQSGVDDRLSTADVRCALKTMTANSQATRRRWKNRKHFCLDPSTTSTPKDQEHEDTPAPVKNFWLADANGVDVVDSIVNELPNSATMASPDRQSPNNENVAQPVAASTSCMPIGYDTLMPECN